MKRIFLLIALALAVLAILPATAAGAAPERVRVLIEFAGPPSAADIAVVEQAGGRIDHVYRIVPTIAATVPASALPGLERNPRVVKVEPDGVVAALDYRSTHDWGIAHIRAGQVHATGNTGSGVRVAVVDTGTSCQQLELLANCQFGPTFVDGTSSSDDDNGHGTHVGGTVAAVRNPGVSTGVVGVAPTATVISYKVLDSGGVGWWSDIIAAIDYIWNNGSRRAEVVNMSLGGSSAPTALEDALNRAYSSGIVLVAAAGNGGTCSGAGDSVSYPARYASVVAVAAVQQDNQRPCFSATGAQVELAAPGVSVFSTWPEDRPTSANNPQPVCENGLCYYKYGSGTSMASPHAAGAAALVIASGVTDANGVNGVADEVRDRLDKAALDLGTSGRDPQYGYGLVDVCKAIVGCGSPTAAAAPTLSASAGNATVRLSWSAPSDGGSAITNYKIYRGTASGGETLLATVGNVTSYDDTTAANGTTYYYQVAAVNALGEGPRSNEVSATPQAPPTVKHYQPAGYTILSGSVYNGLGAVSRLYTNDGSRVEITAAQANGSYVSEISVFASMSAAERASLKKLTVDYDGNASKGSAAITLSIYRWTTNSWVVVDGPRTGVTSDRAFTWSTATSPTDYVSSSGEVRFSIKGTRANSFRTRTDWVHFTIEY